jgi:hypothetical protein
MSARRLGDQAGTSPLEQKAMPLRVLVAPSGYKECLEADRVA